MSFEKDESKMPQRAHTIILKSGADSARELAWELRHFADRIERNELSQGCSGGPSAGTTYSYKVLPDQTHENYFKQIDEWLDRERAEHEGTD